MAEGRQRAAWDQTSELLAMLFNQWAERAQQRSSDFFHPFRRDRRMADPAERDEISVREFGAVLGIKGIPARGAK